MPKQVLTEKEVKHIGKLSNLELSEKETQKFSAELTDILDFVENLSAVDTGETPALSNINEKTNVFREDEVRPGLTQKQALKNAKEAHKGFFKVPAILKE
ncbi:Asp-tRNA(Asn)/Glu-tRNA(Gln) amidotransferase subunit GatC [Candidatus Microgenomates bacterium]|jgi:aspartyl-tRNA(Asn)/glutamyl-tRNA(Gln) amidotransferase subunit C|nr:MAG: Asp-tRNA(Asn)/Glu-tRNA(Gln) amidotransferase subunit GatC [Candidatus Microgenomates bacterium]